MRQEDVLQNFIDNTKAYGSVLGLKSIQRLLIYLGNPQESLACIQVVGTNGKGSVCAFLSQVLSDQGYITGVYTSPAVFDERERFCVNGNWITKEEYCTYFLNVKRACDMICEDGFTHPTIFEVETAVAFCYFKDKKCDLVILEAGMGGKCDATNIISKNVLSVFTSIGMDHMSFLGNSIEEIATVKAGIMKENGNSVSIWQDEKAAIALQNYAKDCKNQLVIVQHKDVVLETKIPLMFSYKKFHHVLISMLGSYQLDNAVCALEVILALEEKGYRFKTDLVLESMKKTHWMGRMEKVIPDAEIYMDGAHNAPAALRLKETLTYQFTNKSITYIIGMFEDKECERVLNELLPIASHTVLFTIPNQKRACDKEKLYQMTQALGYDAIMADNINDALKKAKAFCDDVIVAFGSLSYLGQFRQSVINDENGYDL